MIWPSVLVLIIRRGPWCPIRVEGRGLVVDQRRRRQIAALLRRAFECGEVDERLEDRSWLPVRADGPVELRLVVRTATHHSEDVAGARIDRDQRGLRHTWTTAARQQLIDLGNTAAHRILRVALQVKIQCRVDIDRLRRLRDGGKLLGHRLADEVDEVGRLGIERARYRREGFLRCAVGRIGRDEAAAGHRSQYDVAPFPRLRSRIERRERVRRLNDAGNRGGLAERQVVDVLAEIQPRCLRYAVNRKRSAIAEIDVVQVELEHLFFGRPDVEDDRHELLEDLAAPRALARLLLDDHFLGQEKVPRQLLGNRAGAFQIGAVAERVGDNRAHDANRIDAGMRVVPLIFDGEHGVDHPRWQCGQGYLPPLDARLDERRQHRRVHGDARYRLLADRQRFNPIAACGLRLSASRGGAVRAAGS